MNESRCFPCNSNSAGSQVYEQRSFGLTTMACNLVEKYTESCAKLNSKLNNSIYLKLFSK